MRLLRTRTSTFDSSSLRWLPEVVVVALLATLATLAPLIPLRPLRPLLDSPEPLLTAKEAGGTEAAAGAAETVGTV